MKNLFRIILFVLLATVAKAQVNVIVSLQDVLGNPLTNDTVWIQTYSAPSVNQSSVVLGPKIITNSGPTGIFTNLNMQSSFLYQFTVKDPTYGTTLGGFSIFPTNSSGTINATQCLVPFGTVTFPAGSVSWAVATSDNRYALKSQSLTNGVLLSGTNVFTGTNTFTLPTVFSNAITFGGVTLSSWPSGGASQAVTNINGVTNNTQTLTTGTAGTDFAIVDTAATSNHTFNLPTASAANRGALSSADWTTFNSKQPALGFTPVPNTRQVATTSPLTGGGALSSDLTLSIPQASGAANGFLSSNDFTTFSNKASGNGTLATTSPLTGGGSLSNNLTITIPAATSLASGYLSNVDWVTFNAKQQAITVSAPIVLTGGALSITQSGTAGNGSLTSTDWNTFNGKQAGNANITNFGTLTTNAFQPSSSNLTNWSTLTSNFFVQETNGFSQGQTVSNSVVKGTWTAATGANSGYVWTSDSSGNGSWVVASSGGSGIPTLNGAGTNTILVGPLLTNAVATNQLVISRPNVAQSIASGLILSNSLPAHFNPNTNQSSPSISLYGSALVGSSPNQSQLVIQNVAQGTDVGFPQLSVGDGILGQTIFTADEFGGLTIFGGALNQSDALTLTGGTVQISQYSGSGNRVPYIDNFGNIQQNATTDNLPSGITNSYYSNGLVQAFSDIRYQRKGIKTVTGTYTVTTNDYEIDADTTSGGFTITLPLASFSTNVYVFKNLAANPLVIEAGGSDRIDGAFLFTNSLINKSDVVHSDGSANYRIISEYLTAGGIGIPTLNGTGTNTIIVSNLIVPARITFSGTNIIATNVIIGNTNNTIDATADNSFIAGSIQSAITNGATKAVIIGGFLNKINGAAFSAILGGQGNIISNSATTAVIIGGDTDVIQNNADGGIVIAGGEQNTIYPYAFGSSLFGTYQSTIQSSFASTANYETIFGGQLNNISNAANWSSIVGGKNNVISNSAQNSLAMGQSSIIQHSNSYVWNDNTNAFSTSGANQYLIHATGGVGINTNVTGTNALTVRGSISIPDGNGTFNGNGAGLTNLITNGIYALTNDARSITFAGPHNITNAANGTGTTFTNGVPQIISNNVVVASISTNGHLSVATSGTNLVSVHSVGNTNSGIQFGGSNTNDTSITWNATNLMHISSNSISIPDLAFLQFGTAASPGLAYFQMNSAHGGGGNGSELESVFNQLALAPQSWLQIGNIANANTVASMYMQRTSLSGTTFLPSLLLGWSTGYLSNAVSHIAIANSQGVPNGSNGTVNINFYDALIDQNPNVVPTSVRFQIISGTNGVGTLTRGENIEDLAQITVGSSFGVSWEVAKNTDVLMTGGLTVTNITNSTLLTNRVNTSIMRRIHFASGTSLNAISFPTNWIWISETGLQVSPTNVPASNILYLEVRQEIDSATNYYAHYMLGSYIPFVDPSASQFFAVVTNAGGSLTSLEMAAVNNLVISMKNDGSWNSNDCIYPFVGGTTNSMSWNLKNTNTFRLAFTTTGLTTNSSGVTGDGIAGAIMTSYTPSTGGAQLFLNDSCSISVYQGIAAPIGCFFGTLDFGSHSDALFTNNATTSKLTMQGSGFFNSASFATFKGFWTGTQLNGTTYQYTPSSVNSVTTAANGLSALPPYFLARNGQGSADSFSTGRMEYASIGNGKSAALQAAEAADVLAFETTLGRQ